MADLLRLDHINGLGALTVKFFGDKFGWPLLLIDVETGLLTIDVCGEPQDSHIGSVKEFVDVDGNAHDPETFYVDYIEEAQL